MCRSLILRSIFTAAISILLTSGAVVSTSAQSTSQDYPTPVSTSEIGGMIKARDIGDARLTTYFYTFEGSQGDMFINVVTKNFNGDIDIFNAEGLRPMTKMVIFADVAENETGRVIYLRKPERLILRVEGRTPNDDEASFRIKFAGSFVAVADTGKEQPALPEVRAANESGIRVNSVGTILEVIPKATPTPVETIAQTDPPEDETPPEIERVDAEKNEAVNPETVETEEAERKPEVIITDNLPPKKEITPRRRAPARRTTSRRRTRRPPPAAAAEKPKEKKEDELAEAAKPADDPPEKKEDAISKAEKPAEEVKPPTRRTRAARAKPADPMANIRLVIMLKDGGKIERPMSEVNRFSVDRGILTIIFRNGRIGRHSMLDVAKVTIE